MFEDSFLDSYWESLTESPSWRSAPYDTEDDYWNDEDEDYDDEEDEYDRIFATYYGE